MIYNEKNNLVVRVVAMTAVTRVVVVVVAKVVVMASTKVEV